MDVCEYYIYIYIRLESVTGMRRLRLCPEPPQASPTPRSRPAAGGGLHDSPGPRPTCAATALSGTLPGAAAALRPAGARTSAGPHTVVARALRWRAGGSRRRAVVGRRSFLRPPILSGPRPAHFRPLREGADGSGVPQARALPLRMTDSRRVFYSVRVSSSRPSGEAHCLGPARFGGKHHDRVPRPGSAHCAPSAPRSSACSEVNRIKLGFFSSAPP